MSVSLQGRVKFPTGGIVRKLLCSMIRCDSGTDSYSPDGRSFFGTPEDFVFR